MEVVESNTLFEFRIKVLHLMDLKRYMNMPPQEKMKTGNSKRFFTYLLDYKIVFKDEKINEDGSSSGKLHDIVYGYVKSGNINNKDKLDHLIPTLDYYMNVLQPNLELISSHFAHIKNIIENIKKQNAIGQGYDLLINNIETSDAMNQKFDREFKEFQKIKEYRGGIKKNFLTKTLTNKNKEDINYLIELISYIYIDRKNKLEECCKYISLVHSLYNEN